MSFSVDVKKEIINMENSLKHCALSEIYGLILGNENIIAYGNSYILAIKSENEYYIHRLYNLLKSNFNSNIEISIRRRHTKIYYKLYVFDCLPLLLSLKFVVREENLFVFSHSFNDMLIKKRCCRASFLRGIFMSCGSINDPNKHIHLEFVRHNEKYLKNILKTFDFFQLNCKITNRKDYLVIYIKDSGKLSEFLGLIGTHISLLEFESTKVFKDLRNNINRKQNCDIANLNKTINAAIAQTDDINYIIEKGYFEKLPVDLKEIIDLRLLDTDITLKEIGERLSTPISKSSVYYKFKKINRIANKLRLLQ